MLERVASAMSAAQGIAVVEDLGCVWRGEDGHSLCEVGLSVEAWRGAFFLRLAVTHSRGRGFRKTRVIKWAYSTGTHSDVDAVIADLAAVEHAGAGTRLADTRTRLGRWFDGLTGRAYLGTYTFASPIPGAHATTVTAETAASGKPMLVTLCEKPPKRSVILAHVPHAAFAHIRAAAETLR